MSRWKALRAALRPDFIILMMAFGIALYAHGEAEQARRTCAAQIQKQRSSSPGS